MEANQDRGPPRPCQPAIQRPPSEGDPQGRTQRQRDPRGESRIPRGPPRGQRGDPRDPRGEDPRGDSREHREPIDPHEPRDPRAARGRGDPRGRGRGDPRGRGIPRGRGTPRGRGGRPRPPSIEGEPPELHQEAGDIPQERPTGRGRGPRDRSRDPSRRDSSQNREGEEPSNFQRGDNLRQSRENLEHRRLPRRDRRDRPPSWSSASEDPRGDPDGPPRRHDPRDPRLRRRHESREPPVTDSDQTPDREQPRPKSTRGGMAPHQGRVSPPHGRRPPSDRGRPSRRGQAPDIRTTISPPSSSTRDSPTSAQDGYKADISPSIDSPLPSSHGGATPRIARARSPARAPPARTRSPERPRDLLPTRDQRAHTMPGAVTPNEPQRSRDLLPTTPTAPSQQLSTTPGGHRGRFPSQRGRSPTQIHPPAEAVSTRRQSISPPPEPRVPSRRPSTRDIPAQLEPTTSPPHGPPWNDPARRKSASHQHLPSDPPLEMTKRNSMIIHPSADTQSKNSDQAEVSKIREKQIPNAAPSNAPSAAASTNATPSPAPSRTPSRFQQQQDDGPNVELLRTALKVSQRAGTAHGLNMPASSRQNVMFYQNRFVVKPPGGAAGASAVAGDNASEQSTASGARRPQTLSQLDKQDGILPQNEVKPLDLTNKMSANRPIEMDATSVTMETDVIKVKKRTLLSRMLSILEDDRVKSSHGTIDLSQGQDTHRALKRALNIVFVTIGILLFIAVVVVIIYTQIDPSVQH